MKIELLKDCKLTKTGLKKKKGMRFIVHNDKGEELIRKKIAEKVSDKNELTFKGK